MALDNVCDFMRHHTREFRFISGCDNEARVDAYVPAWHRERVNDVFPHPKSLDLWCTAWRKGGKLARHMIQILLNIGVADVIRIASALLHNGLAEFTFEQGRQIRSGSRT